MDPKEELKLAEEEIKLQILQQLKALVKGLKKVPAGKQQFKMIEEAVKLAHQMRSLN